MKAVKGHEDKTKLKKAELLGIKFITTEKGADLLNEISRVFDLVDVKQKDSKEELSEDDDDVYRCDSCGHLEKYQFKYCPNCGVEIGSWE